VQRRGFSFSGAIEVLIGRVQRIGKVLLLAALVAIGLTLLLFLLERYVIGRRVPEMEPPLLHEDEAKKVEN